MTPQEFEHGRKLIIEAVIEHMPTTAFASGLTDLNPEDVHANAIAYVKTLTLADIPEHLGLSRVREWLSTRPDAPKDAHPLFAKYVRHEMILERMRSESGVLMWHVHAK